jgi:hypothetical protein
MNKLMDMYPSSGDEAAGADPQELRRYGAAVFAVTEGSYVADGAAGYLEFHARDVAERAKRMGQSPSDEPTEEELAIHDAKPSTIATREVLGMWKSGDDAELRMGNDHRHSQNNPPLMPWDLKT